MYRPPQYNCTDELISIPSLLLKEKEKENFSFLDQSKEEIENFIQLYGGDADFQRVQTEWEKLNPEEKILAVQAIKPFKDHKEKTNQYALAAHNYLGQKRFLGFKKQIKQVKPEVTAKPTPKTPEEIERECRELEQIKAETFGKLLRRRSHSEQI